MKALIIGGLGHLGQKTKEALGRVQDIDLFLGSHRKPTGGQIIHFDLTKPETYARADSFDLIINCTDTYRTPPDAFIRYCLEREMIFMETSAEPALYIRIWDSTELIRKTGKLK